MARIGELIEIVEIELPPALTQFLRDSPSMNTPGHGVAVPESGEELSTDPAADLLNDLRPFPVGPTP